MHGKARRATTDSLEQGATLLDRGWAVDGAWRVCEVPWMGGTPHGAVYVQRASLPGRTDVPRGALRKVPVRHPVDSPRHDALDR